jgi:outer membrane biogenesis lipoprotein LolB
MRPERRAVLLVLAATTLLAGCLSPAERAATERAWAERDRERAEECAQRGGRYISSSCIQGGGP